MTSDLLHYSLLLTMEELKLCLLMNHMHYAHVNVKRRYFPLILQNYGRPPVLSLLQGKDTNREVRAEQCHPTLTTEDRYQQHVMKLIFHFTFITSLYIFTRLPKRKFGFWSCEAEQETLSATAASSQNTTSVQHHVNNTKPNNGYK